MSELKERMLGQTMSSYGCDTKIYLKSEADKVIADLKQIRKQQDVLLGKALNTISKSHKHIVSLARQCNHANYKRCLAMRNMCRYAQYSYSYLMENEGCKIRPNNIDFRKYNKKYHFYIRWRNRWMKLAEKFKEAK